MTCDHCPQPGELCEREQAFAGELELRFMTWDGYMCGGDMLRACVVVTCDVWTGEREQGFAGGGAGVMSRAVHVWWCMYGGCM